MPSCGTTSPNGIVRDSTALASGLDGEAHIEEARDKHGRHVLRSTATVSTSIAPQCEECLGGTSVESNGCTLLVFVRQDAFGTRSH
jgi:hypothetical protein